MIYLDKNDRKLIVSQGIGHDSWGVFRVKPSGSLQRIKTIPMSESKAVVEETFVQYATKHKLKGYKEND